MYTCSGGLKWRKLGNSGGGGGGGGGGGDGGGGAGEGTKLRNSHTTRVLKSGLVNCQTVVLFFPLA
jgi:hypothetical protein